MSFNPAPQGTVAYEVCGKEHIGGGRFEVAVSPGIVDTLPALSAETLKRATYGGEFFEPDSSQEIEGAVMEYLDRWKVRISTDVGVLVTGRLCIIGSSVSYTDYESGGVYSYSTTNEIVVPEREAH